MQQMQKHHHHKMHIYCIKDFSNEIQHKIMSYIYAIQPKELQHDIYHYYISRNAIERIYYEIWIDDFGEVCPEHINWLINDIIGYVNESQALTTGIVDHFYNVFFRYYMLKTKPKRKLHKFVKHLFLEPTYKQVQIFWGLLTPTERNGFIFYIKRTYWDQHVRIINNLQDPLFS